MSMNSNALTVEEAERINKLLADYELMHKRPEKKAELIPFPKEVIKRKKQRTSWRQFKKDIHDIVLFSPLFVLGYTLLLELGMAVCIMVGIW